MRLSVRMLQLGWESCFGFGDIDGSSEGEPDNGLQTPLHFPSAARITEEWISVTLRSGFKHPCRRDPSIFTCGSQVRNFQLSNSAPFHAERIPHRRRARVPSPDSTATCRMYEDCLLCSAPFFRSSKPVPLPSFFLFCPFHSLPDTIPAAPNPSILYLNHLHLF